MTSDRRIFDAVPPSALSVRRFVTAMLRAEGADERTVKNLTLAASELVSNIILHGRCPEVCVSVQTSETWWTVEVRGGQVFPSDMLEPAGWAFPPTNDLSGRGLAIARDVVDEIWVRDHEGELCISCRLRRIV